MRPPGATSPTNSTPSRSQGLRITSATPEPGSSPLGGPVAKKLRSHLLYLARLYAQNNLADAMYTDVPDPAGAVKLGTWEAEMGGRYFDGSSRVVNRDDRRTDITVEIIGIQYADGHVVEREIRVDVSGDEPLTLAQARQLAEALNAATDEAEKMSGYDPLVTAT